MTILQTQRLLLGIVILASCSRSNSDTDKQVTNTDSTMGISTVVPPKTFSLKDTTIKFLWRDKKYDEELKETVNAIFINEAYCKTITDPERAALGYVATFIGNECWWDGEYKEDRSNLKCKILTALDLGYQCSDKHLGFLRQWFKNDTIVLEELENCPTTPHTATLQETFDEITLTVKGNTISVWFRANGVNVSVSDSWRWKETDYFQLDTDNLRLIKKEKEK